MSVGVSSDSTMLIETVKKYFADYRPVIKSMSINFNNRTSEIFFSFKIEEGFRKKHAKIKIPNFQGFRIVEMQNADFNSIKDSWVLIDNDLVLDAKSLPLGIGYFLKLEGKMDYRTIKELVHIQTSANRDLGDDVDRYWLSVSLKDSKKLENIWTDLNVDKIDVNVKVDVNKLFAMHVP